MSTRSDESALISGVEGILKSVAGNPQAMGILMLLGAWFLRRTHVPQHHIKVWQGNPNPNAPPDLRLGTLVDVLVPETYGLDLDIVHLKGESIQQALDEASSGKPTLPGIITLSANLAYLPVAPWAEGISTFVNNLFGYKPPPDSAAANQNVLPAAKALKKEDWLVVHLSDVLMVAGFVTLVGSSFGELKRLL